MARLTCLVAALILFAGGTAIHGQQPGKKDVELLPPPKEKDGVPPPQVLPPGVVILPYAPTPFPQHGTRDVWQLYAVDRSGRWRPRVIMSPYGAYYMSTGAPYPWTTTRPGNYMPYVLD